MRCPVPLWSEYHQNCTLCPVVLWSEYTHNKYVPLAMSNVVSCGIVVTILLTASGAYLFCVYSDHNTTGHNVQLIYPQWYMFVFCYLLNRTPSKDRSNISIPMQTDRLVSCHTTNDKAKLRRP